MVQDRLKWDVPRVLDAEAEAVGCGSRFQMVSGIATSYYLVVPLWFRTDGK